MTETSYKFVREVAVRFRDIDAMGHAHHSMVLIYIEEVRAAFWREIVGRVGLAGIDYVLAQVTINFRERIEFPDTLTVGLRIAKVGGASFTMHYELRNSAGVVVATAETVQVMYDYEANKSKPIDDHARAQLEAYA